ncbi:hypothetical protein R1sor_008906 [Riccia sorocarpa]|uniref:Uncharacterized protein n=1 Tax=Riccia sorocarpa TaxID=122646 RepID=A0ABD3H724_9MARC
MLKYIPEKADKEVAADETSSSDVETDDGNTRRRKKGKKKSYGADPLPSQIASAIHRIYCAKRGESSPQRLEPLQVLLIKDITKYQLTLDEKLDCPLVFLDLTHPHMHAWEKPEFSSFLGIVCDLTVSKCFAVVSIMDFGQAPVDFAKTLKDMKDARVTVDYGCYEQTISLRPFLLEIQPSKWKKEMNVDKGDHAEGINVMDKAPRWEFVGMTFHDDSMSFVHPLNKRRTFCEKMIMNFSSEGDTVLDFFSGGVFTREALLKGRDIVYFANSSFESEFITKYSKALCKFSQRISDWFVQFRQGKKPAVSTHVVATVGDYHASSSDVNVASVVVDDQITNDAWHRLGAEAQLEYEVESEAEDEGHKAPEELHDSGVAELENVAEDLQQLPDSGEPPPSPNQQSCLDLQATSGQAVDPPAVATMGTGELPAVNPLAVATMETGKLPAVNPPAVEIMGQTTVAEDDKPQSQSEDVQLLASGSCDKWDGKGTRKTKKPRTRK